MTRPTRDEGRRVLRNAVSFGQFLFAPISMTVMSRALAPEGYGRWWWTFVLLEAAGTIGMLGADLYVRRELPRLASGGNLEATHRVVGSAISVALVPGLAFCVAQMLLARPIAYAQGDPALAQFLVILACQPVLANLTAVLAAALQSMDDLEGVAVLRGIVAPMASIGFFACAWSNSFPVSATLIGMALISATVFLVVLALYARRFDVRATLAAVSRPEDARAILSFGLPLLLPTFLFTLGGKIDLQILRLHVTPAVLGTYAACLQVVSVLPSTRAIFDPIAQRQIGALATLDRARLGESLTGLSRLCTLALIPSFVGLVAVGEPVLAWLLGHHATATSVTIAILSLGQLFGSLAVAASLVPMLDRGPTLSVIALATLVVKLLLLLSLVPVWGVAGAACATAIGTVVAQQGMAFAGTRRFEIRLDLASLIPLLASAMAVAALGGLLFRSFTFAWGTLHSVIATSVVLFVALLVVGFAHLDEAERDWLRERVLRSSSRIS